MRIAVIDCGTNTFNLLIADPVSSVPEVWKTVFTNKIPVKLGEGGFLSKEIVTSRFVRGIDALYCHSHNISNYECQRVHAFATSAIREASNGKEFQQKAKEIAGIEIEIIDGNREAELIFRGVKQTIELDEKPVLVMDIGGGSTEFIIANSAGILWKKSFLLGVSRLHEKIQPQERLTQEDSRNLTYEMDNGLTDLKAALAIHAPKRLVGTSGSFDTLFSLFLFGRKKESASTSSLLNEIPLTALPSIHAWLAGSSLDERLKHPAIPAIRAQYMPLASFFIKYVLDLQPLEKVYHSAYSLKEGAMAEIISAMDLTTVHSATDLLSGDEDMSGKPI